MSLSIFTFLYLFIFLVLILLKEIEMFILFWILIDYFVEKYFCLKLYNYYFHLSIVG